MVPIPTPGFPFLACGASTQASYLLSLEAKKTGPPLPFRGSRLRYWLRPSLASAHLWERASKPLHFELDCSLYQAYASSELCTSSILHIFSAMAPALLSLPQLLRTPLPRR
jgi:hypothetical protein